MLKEIIIAIQAYFTAHRFIQENKLWKWILIPGILYAILFMISMYYFGHTCNNFIEWLSLKTGLKTWLDKMDSGFLGFIFALSTFMLWLAMMLLYFSLFKYFFLVVGSPVFAYLSEKTEAILEGKEYPFSFKQLTRDITRGIRIAVRNALWQTVYCLSILLISIFPLVGWLTPVLAIVIECYYYGFSMLDYSMERNKKTTAESIFYIGQHRGLAVGNGLVFYLMHLLPIIGWVLAPAYAVIAATLSLIDVKKGHSTISIS